MAATSVGAGILLSRLAGIARSVLFAKYFGQRTEAADAFQIAFRIPNLLQNLFGEGALSASFIPVHSGLRARGEHEAAAHMARTFFAILAITMAVLVLLGVLAAPLMVTLIAPGFTGAKRQLTTHLVRVLFPGAGLLVASAWCLGVLNSHGKFFLSYTAPVAWNAAMIATMLYFGEVDPHGVEWLAMDLAWGSVAGSFLQFALQAPMAFRLSRHPERVKLTEPVRQAIRNFLPALVSRGAVQLSAFVDSWIASWLPTGGVAALANSQLLYTLPVSLFGISVSAAELPAMSADATGTAGFAPLRARIDAALGRLAFFVVPSAVAFAALGDVIAAAVLQRGRFETSDALYVWGILAGSSIGLLASTMARLYSAAHYALGDTRRPLRFALTRLTVGAALGYVFAIILPPQLGVAAHWGAAGLTAASGVAGWIEFALLRASLNQRIGPTGLGATYLARLWIAGLAAAAVAWGVRLALPPLDPIVRGAVVLPAFGATFLAAAVILRLPLSALRGRGR